MKDDSCPVLGGDESCAGRFVDVEELICGFDGWDARLTQGLVAAVVEEEVGGTVAALIVGYAALEIGEDLCGWKWVPVQGRYVPLNRGEAEGASGAKDVGAAGSVRGAEEADRDAQSVFEGAVAGGELFADAGCGLPGEPGVGHGVVPDKVSGSGYGAGEIGPLAYEAADHEESGADVVAGQDFEEALGDAGVGAVVVGQGDLVGAGASNEDFAEELGLGPEGGVGPGSGEESGGGGGCGDFECGVGHGGSALLLLQYPTPLGGTPW